MRGQADTATAAMGEHERKLYLALTHLYERARRGVRVDPQELRAAEQAWVEAAAARIGKVGVRRSVGDGYHAGGKGVRRA